MGGIKKVLNFERERYDTKSEVVQAENERCFTCGRSVDSVKVYANKVCLDCFKARLPGLRKVIDAGRESECRINHIASQSNA